MARRAVVLALYALCLVCLTAFLFLHFVLQNPVHSLHLWPTTPAGERARPNGTAEGDYLLGVGKADITG